MGVAAHVGQVAKVLVGVIALLAVLVHVVEVAKQHARMVAMLVVVIAGKSQLL